MEPLDSRRRLRAAGWQRFRTSPHGEKLFLRGSFLSIVACKNRDLHRPNARCASMRGCATPASFSGLRFTAYVLRRRIQSKFCTKIQTREGRGLSSCVRIRGGGKYFRKKWGGRVLIRSGEISPPTR